MQHQSQHRKTDVHALGVEAVIPLLYPALHQRVPLDLKVYPEIKNIPITDRRAGRESAFLRDVIRARLWCVSEREEKREGERVSE